MNDALGQDRAQVAQQENDFEEALEVLRSKNAELQGYAGYLKKENSIYKKKYQEFRQQITGWNELLEKNARIFHALFDDMKSALQMSTISFLSVSTPKSQKEKSTEKVKSSPTPGPSGPSALHQKIQIERLNFQALEDAMENEEERLSENSIETNEQLSVIEEENSASLKEAYVSLSQLPCDIIKEHLEKNVDSDKSTVDSPSINLAPEFASTPLKIKTMEKLGLYPVEACRPQKHNFVNVRKRENNSDVDRGKKMSPTKDDQLVPAKKQKVSKNEVDSGRVEKRNDLNQVEGSPANRRPQRRAKPRQLKEVSLKK